MLKKYACLLTVCTLSLSLFACGTNDETVTVSEELVSEEVSEEMSTEVISEEVSETKTYDDVQIVEWNDYEGLMEYIDTLGETVLVVVNENGTAALLRNGEYYKCDAEEGMTIESSKGIKDITSEKDSVIITPGAMWSEKEYGNLTVWHIVLREEGTYIEVPLTITLVSVTGETTKEEFTVYITQE
ncbi:MAG: hypothetical protein IJA29_05305 [Lachnospiraceae bacterium]|nr:hypothetical protein [Lachnospiraceae bacterium]